MTVAIKPLLLLASLSLFWGLNWPGMKIILAELPVWWFRASCLIVGGSLLLSLSALSGHRWKLKREEIKPVMFCGIFAILGWMVFSAYGVSQMPAGRASIIAFTMPLWASISAYYLLDEPFNKSKIFGLLLGLIGLGVLIGPDLLILKQAPIGALFMLGAAMSWAFGTILIKKTEWQLTPLTNVAWQLLFSAVPITGVALMLEPLPDVTQLSARASIALIYLYLFPMSFCQWAYFKVVGLLPASIAAIGTLLVPVVGVYSSYLILDEQVAATDIVALLLVMSALVMVLLVPAWRASSKRRNGHQNTKLDDVQRDR